MDQRLPELPDQDCLIDTRIHASFEQARLEAANLMRGSHIGEGHGLPMRRGKVVKIM
jgi:hypothetical protein